MKRNRTSRRAPIQRNRRIRPIMCQRCVCRAAVRCARTASTLRTTAQTARSKTSSSGTAVPNYPLPQINTVPTGMYPILHRAARTVFARSRVRAAQAVSQRGLNLLVGGAIHLFKPPRLRCAAPEVFDILKFTPPEIASLDLRGSDCYVPPFVFSHARIP